MQPRPRSTTTVSRREPQSFLWLVIALCNVSLAAPCRAQVFNGVTDPACTQAYTARQYRVAAACFAKFAGHPGLPASAAASALLSQARSLLAAADATPADATQAEEVLRASLRTDPRQPEALYLLGLLLQRRNAPAESLKLYTEAASLRTPTGEDLRIVALDYVLLGSYPDALHWLQQAVALSPRNAEAWYDLGRAHMHDGRFADAITALRQSLSLRPGSAKAEDNLGVSLEAENHTDDAASAYDRAVKLADAEPHVAGQANSEQPYVDYGTLLNTRNGFHEAALLLQRATELNPKSSRAFAELSRAYTGLGQGPAALAAMQRAVALDPGNSRLHFQLGRLYRTAGNTALAQQEFDLSSKLYGQKSSE